MNRFDNCIRCGKQNLDLLKINTRINMNYSGELRNGVITQRVIGPTDALVCKDCGHIELFIDWSHNQK